MQRMTVESSELRSIGYDAAAEILEVQFQSGEVYRYYEVPQEVYDGLLAAPSCGRYFNAAIRNVFRHRRVSGA